MIPNLCGFLLSAVAVVLNIIKMMMGVYESCIEAEKESFVK